MMTTCDLQVENHPYEKKKIPKIVVVDHGSFDIVRVHIILLSKSCENAYVLATDNLNRESWMVGSINLV